jgi:hypothetical protein
MPAAYDLACIRAAAEAPALSAYERRLKDMLLQLLPMHEAAAGVAPDQDYEPSIQEIAAFRNAVRRRGSSFTDDRCIAEGLKAARQARVSSQDEILNTP